MPSFVAFADGRRHSLTLLRPPATIFGDKSLFEEQARNISSQLRSLLNVERLIFLHGSYTESEVVQYLGVLPDWRNLQQIDCSTQVIKVLATLKDLHSRLPAVKTLSMRWTWRSQLLRNDLVFWSRTLRNLTLSVRFIQL